VGVSGGVDSLALLLAAAELATERLGVASLDHGLRQGSAAEVDWVRSLAASRGLPFHTAKLGLEPGPGMEARAREARYAALERIAHDEGYGTIATAHTADDQAETLLMRLARGAALRGAGSIRANRGLYLRPLLEVRRADTERLVAAAGLTPVRDPTNVDPRLFRARVRGGVIPALQEAAGPEVVLRLAAFARTAQEDEAYLSELAERALARVREGMGLEAVGVRALPWPIRARVFRRWLEGVGLPVSDVLLHQVDAAVGRGGRTGLPGRALLRAEGGWVRITPAPGGRAPAAPAGNEVSGNEVSDTSGGGNEVSDTSGAGNEVSDTSGGGDTSGAGNALSENEMSDTSARDTSARAAGARVQGPPERVVLEPGTPIVYGPFRLSLGEGPGFPLGAGSGPFAVRARQPGDRVRVAGGPARRVQDVLVDAAVPAEARAGWPLVVDREDRVLWVVGLWPRPHAGPGPWLRAERLAGAPGNHAL
jgi:tRNA(Ile)-lysidine synthase